MSVFALVHGSMHGSWCWRDLVPELSLRGHSAISLDLPCEDADAGLAQYAAAVETHLTERDVGDDVVLVGHSLGSRTIPIVAAQRPRSRMIFLCSVPTGLGPVDPEAFAGMVTTEFAEAEVEQREDGARLMAQESARRVFFDDCDETLARWASRQLRWQGPKPLLEPAPIDRWPDVPSSVILTRDDRAVRLDWAMAEASRWVGDQALVLLPGSHSPFFSRPGVLAETLIRCASD